MQRTTTVNLFCSGAQYTGFLILVSTFFLPVYMLWQSKLDIRLDANALAIILLWLSLGFCCYKILAHSSFFNKVKSKVISIIKSAFIAHIAQAVSAEKVVEVNDLLRMNDPLEEISPLKRNMKFFLSRSGLFMKKEK